jgi:hypothetical protein
MTQELTIPNTWFEKVSGAVGIEQDELSIMVHRMFQRGSSKAEIEQAMVFLAKSNGKTLSFVRSDGRTNV